MKKILFVDIYDNNQISFPSVRVNGSSINDVNTENMIGFRIVTTTDENIDIKKLFKKMMLIENDQLVFEDFSCEQEIYYCVPKYKYDELLESEKKLLLRVYGRFSKLCSYFVIRNEDKSIHDIVPSTDYMYYATSKEELQDAFNKLILEYSDKKIKS